MKKILVKALSFALMIICVFSCVACEGENENATKLSFKSALEYDYLKSIDGQTVTINGYLATSSPVDGSFIFLMNMPYQSCPFCVPNTNQLSNTMEVYPKKGETFSYTNQAVKVVGTLEVAEDPEKPFTDKYGYEFSFKIVDAEFTILKSEDLSEEMASFQRFANTGIIDDIYKMFDYVNFVSVWNTYYVKSGVSSDGTPYTGYYLTPEHVNYYLTTNNAQYNYGYKDGYFDNIINDIKAIDANAFSDLVKIIEDAKNLSKDALAEFEAGNYSKSSEPQYFEELGFYSYVYTITNGEALSTRNEAIYSAFAEWIASYEM